MIEAIKCIRAKGLKTAVLSNNFYLHSGESFLPLDRRQFDVVSLEVHIDEEKIDYINTLGSVVGSTE